MKKTQIKKLEKLREKANTLSAKQDELVRDALQITREENVAGFTFDYILNNYGTTDQLLKRLGLKRD